MYRLCAVLATVLLATPIFDVQAQNPRRTERAFVASPAALGMGDVGVARPFGMSSFFYNPAHAPKTGSATRAFGMQGAFSDQVRDQVRFYNNELSPAIDRGLDDIPTDEIESLYNDALAVTATPSQGHASVLLPALTRQVTDGVGVGGGLFMKTDGSFQFFNAGLGIPQVTLTSRTDFMGVASAGVDLPVRGLSVGTTVKYTKRYLSYKDKPLDTFSSDEQVVLLEGANLGMDVGALYTLSFLPVPGDVTVGVSVYDLLHTGYNYEVYGTPSDIPVVGAFVGDSEPLDASRVAAEVSMAKRRFSLGPSYRFGAAYTLGGFGPLSDLSVAADYVGYGSPQIDQSMLASMHLGARANLTRFLALRAGISQGYPSLGAGLNLGVFRLEYALHAFEEGRVPGQLSNYIHTAQFSFQL
jgi:hypothetical protein